MKEVNMYYSRCSCGKNRWFWIVYRGLLSYWDENEPIAKGFATSPEECHINATAEVGTIPDSNRALEAQSYRKWEVCDKKMKQASTSEKAANLEFAWECHWSHSEYYDDPKVYHSINKHRIIKRTKKRIYVDVERYLDVPRNTGKWYDYDQTTFILDRKVFEETGKAKRASRGWWDDNVYYADPKIYYAEYEGNRYRPEWAIGLNVSTEASEKEVKLAYQKLVKVNHPDRGGDPEKFKQVRKWYEEALQV